MSRSSLCFLCGSVEAIAHLNQKDCLIAQKKANLDENESYLGGGGGGMIMNY